MLIVDAQIHLWNAGNPTSAWHRQVPAYLKDDALREMDAGGVDAALLTPQVQRQTRNNRTRGTRGHHVAGATPCA
jgi:predicted TIM-barrel fold metal-dependent hydrolase